MVYEYINDLLQDETKKVTLAVSLMNDFEFFIKTVFRLIHDSDFIIKDFHKVIINKLEKLEFGENEKRNLALCLPVGSGKSILMEYFIAWSYCRDVNKSFLYNSHSQDLIVRRSREIKEILEDELISTLFGLELKKDERSKINWSFEGAKHRTGLKAKSTGSRITGEDAGHPSVEGFSGALIIDDIMDAHTARSDLMREDVIQFYNNKLATRRRTPRTPTILIMQRLHKEDLINWVKENEPDLWDIVEIKAFDEKTGESFWPERFPVEELLHIKNVHPETFYAQYQQSPISLGGQVIKTGWFNYWATGDLEREKIKRVFITADTAMKVKEHSDYSVFCVWASTGINLYLLDMYRGKWEFPELKQQAVQLWNKWRMGVNGVANSCLYVEDKVSGTGLIQELRKLTAIPILPIPREKDKLTRVSAVLNYIEAGRVFLPRDNTLITNQVISECGAFCRDDSHAHDDIVDCLVDGVVQGLHAGGTYSIAQLL